MNSSYQVAIALLIVALAVIYLVWLVKKSSSSKGCGGGCDCHHKNHSADDPEHS
jgi:hypothetical protein